MTHETEPMRPKESTLTSTRPARHRVVTTKCPHFALCRGSGKRRRRICRKDGTIRPKPNLPIDPAYHAPGSVQSFLEIQPSLAGSPPSRGSQGSIERAIQLAGPRRGLSCVVDNHVEGRFVFLLRIASRLLWFGGGGCCCCLWPRPSPGQKPPWARQQCMWLLGGFSPSVPVQTSK